jgi:hypothetical protein
VSDRLNWNFVIRLSALVISSSVACLSAVGEDLKFGFSGSNEISLGSLNENENRPIKFWIQNDSQAVREIVKIETSCACTSVTLTGEKALPPSEKREVTGIINFGYLPGSYEALVYIYSKTKSSSEIEETLVRFKGRVESPLILSGRHFDLGVLDLSENPKSAVLQAKRGNDSLPWDEIVVGSTPNLKVSIERIDSTRFRIGALVDPKNLPIGQNRLIASLSFSQKGKMLPGCMEIPVLVRIVGPVRAEPSTLHFGVLDKSENSKSIKISASAPLLKDLQFSIEDPRILVELDSSNELEALLKVTIRGGQGYKSRAVASKIQIKTASGLFLNIPVIALFKGGGG